MSLAEGIKTIKKHLKQMPAKPGVYRMIAADGEVLYVGKAKNLPKRVISYTKGESMQYRLQRMVSLTRSMEIIIAGSEAGALLIEANLINKLQPRFNIQLKDNKSFPFILLTADKDFDMLVKHRGKQNKKGDYFGPFPSAGAVNKTLNSLQKAFPLRSCSDNVLKAAERPCLEYQIKRCSAPCVDKISTQDYAKIVEEARGFLRGKTADIQKRLAEQMEGASKDLQYERAAQIRDRITALSRVQSEGKLNIKGTYDADVVALYREGGNACVQIFFVRVGQNCGNRAYFPNNTEGVSEAEIISTFLGQFYQRATPPKNIFTSVKPEGENVLQDALEMRSEYKIKISQPKRGDKFELIKLAKNNAKDALLRKVSETSNHRKMLEEVKERFNLPEAPRRIEVYDNSHISGTNAIGAMIVVGEEGFDKSSYRKFNIKNSNLSDDFDMMREVFRRRFAGSQKEKSNKPDVVLIDGGKGQLSVVAEVMKDIGAEDIKLIAISKGEDRNAGREEYHQLNAQSFALEYRSELAFFMQRIRDESHRFAISSHRAKRSKDFVKSALDEIEGIGGVRKKVLLNHFGSVKAIGQAEIAELMRVEGVSKKTASDIYNHFH